MDVEAAELTNCINHQAERAMNAAFETFDSLHRLALLYVQYFDSTEEQGWAQLMLQDAKDKTYQGLPKNSSNPWRQLKVTSRAAFQRCNQGKSFLPLQ